MIEAMESSAELEKQDWPVEIIRSSNRSKTVNAQLQKGVLVIRAPAHMSDAELQPVIDNLRRRLEKRVRPTPQTDIDLEKRAQALNKLYFNGRLHWQSIRYVENQNTRYGSCTPANGTIRLSNRLATMPAWVRDYVIIHELAHLLEGNHGPRFWKLVNRYPLTERARGYLMAIGLEEEQEN